MNKIRPATILLGGASFAAFAAAAVCELEVRRYPTLLAGLTPLRTPFDRKIVRASFEAVWSEPHYVALLFPSSPDSDTLATVHRLASNVGHVAQEVSPFDFEWRVLGEGVEIGRGTGRRRTTSVIGTDDGIALAFGEFPAIAGRHYEFEAREGPVSSTLQRAKPIVAIGVSAPGPSLSLPWTKEFGRPFAVLFSLVGLAFSGATIVALRK